ncbi:MAG: hypothetical protein JWQ86_928 [Mycobacterium sp.]|nr:hypothetical protein [Mycobacterium sp.]
MTVTPTRSPFHLLIGGTRVHLEGVQPGVAIGIDRPSSETTSLGGVRRTQVARRAARSWDLSFAYESAEAVRWLRADGRSLALKTRGA